MLIFEGLKKKHIENRTKYRTFSSSANLEVLRWFDFSAAVLQ